MSELGSVERAYADGYAAAQGKCEVDRLENQAGQVRQLMRLESKITKLRAVLEDALLVLEVQFGKAAEPGSLIFQIRAALANEEGK